MTDLISKASFQVVGVSKSASGRLPPIVNRIQEMKIACAPTSAKRVSTREISSSSAVITHSGSRCGSAFQNAIAIDLQTTAAPLTPSTETFHRRTPKSMSRAKTWNVDVENAFRFQEAGFLDYQDYLSDGHEAPELWPTHFIKCLKAKKTGFFLYFRNSRECSDKHLNKIKIYSY